MFWATFGVYLEFLHKRQITHFSWKWNEIQRLSQNFCVTGHLHAKISEMDRDTEISTKCLTHRLWSQTTDVFTQKLFSHQVLAAILNFCMKHKNIFIYVKRWDRAISAKALTSRVSGVYWHETWFQQMFGPTGSLESLHAWNTFFLEMVWDREIWAKLFNPRVSVESPGHRKIVLLPFLAAIWNYCVKCKTHLSRKQRDRVIFDQQGVCKVYSQLFA